MRRLAKKIKGKTNVEAEENDLIIEEIQEDDWNPVND